MVTAAERARVRERLLELARADESLAGAAITGSHATGTEDRWSDVDLAFAVHGDRQVVLERWTAVLYEDFGALHHWDLPFGATVFRVFLLEGGLEVDLAFAPPEEFGPRGPGWRAVFGEPVAGLPAPPLDRGDLVGRAWHHVLHARGCIERGQPWQAEHWLAGVRDHVLSLACLRLGLPARHAKGADGLPADATRTLEATLVRSLDPRELRRALAAAAAALIDEVERWDAALADRLQPVLDDAAGSAAP